LLRPNGERDNVGKVNVVEMRGKVVLDLWARGLLNQRRTSALKRRRLNCVSDIRDGSKRWKRGGGQHVFGDLSRSLEEDEQL
jgi:hypothetical protein